MATKGRMETNEWLRKSAANITGDILSIGSGSDDDAEGGHYKDYFVSASSYTTSETDGGDIHLDVRNMPQIPDGRYHGVFCCAVLEHVDNVPQAIAEMTRVLSKNGIFLVNFAFRQKVHAAPDDYWRFTPSAITYLLGNRYEILEWKEIDPVDDFPSAYWIKARKI